MNESYIKRINRTLKEDYILLEETLQLETREPIRIYIQILLNKRKRFPIHYWDNGDEKLVMIVKWLLEEYLKVPYIDIPKVIGQSFLRKYKLFGVLNNLFGGSVYDFIDLVYPNKYKAWQMNKVPNYYWDKETKIEATKWLIQDYLHLQVDSTLKVKRKDFKDNGLSFMRNGLTVRQMLTITYPDVFNI